MPRADTPTLLSLDRYAGILGLDPLHFAGGYSDTRPPVKCDDLWQQYDWQDGDKVSRSQVATLIAEAERDIADVLGYYPAPTWIVDERVPYTHPQRTDITATGLTSRYRAKTARLNRGYFIQGGQRAVTALNDGDPVDYVTLDADADGYDELAVFTITVDADLDVCEVKTYFKEYNPADAENCRTDPASTGADPAWEIRPLNSTLVGTTLTVYVKRWELFKPQLHEALNAAAIDADVAANYVDELLFYREYNDPSTQVQFLWGEDTYCNEGTCEWSTQSGCLRVHDSRTGLVVPQPGTYDAITDTFTAANWAECVEPDALRVWYQAGYQPDTDAGCIALDHFWAKNIAILATSRTDWPICTCSNVELLTARWRADLALTTDERSFVVDADALNNPFGTRWGETYVWKRLKGRGRRRGQAVRV